MADTFYLQNRIQLEINNLERGHVYYSIDEQPEVCARLIAEVIGFDEPPPMPFEEKETGETVAEMIARKVAEKIKEQMRREAIFGYHHSVTVNNWDDAEKAIGLIIERQRELKRRAGR